MHDASWVVSEMNLIAVGITPDAPAFLYDLLSERPRENWISHEHMPGRSAHKAFVASHPFRYWYLIKVNGDIVGALEVTYLNEIGIAILKAHQRKGYASEALKMFLLRHEPLPAIPAKRNGHWVANIAVGNEASKAFFASAKFKPIQETWLL